MTPAASKQSQAGRSSGERHQARDRDTAPAPQGRPIRPVRIHSSHGQLPDTPAAACASHDPGLWFSDSPADIAQATALCHRCPDRAPCLSGAIDRRETYGIWGGTHFTVQPREDEVA
jgi:hypothetical protein